MNEKEELIFGLKRWLKKGVDYLKDKSPEELMKDELTFDALCFVFLMIKDITNRILSYPELLKRHSNVNFIEIKDLYYDVSIKMVVMFI